jgi:outer membrane protein assembly factor BamD (BamD/ComL family)
MSKAMYQKVIYSIVILIFISSCTKKEPDLVNIPADKEEAFKIYKEAVTTMNSGDFFLASKKFTEAESVLPGIELAAKASLMSS